MIDEPFMEDNTWPISSRKKKICETEISGSKFSAIEKLKILNIFFIINLNTSEPILFSPIKISLGLPSTS